MPADLFGPGDGREVGSDAEQGRRGAVRRMSEGECHVGADGGATAGISGRAGMA